MTRIHVRAATDSVRGAVAACLAAALVAGLAQAAAAQPKLAILDLEVIAADSGKVEPNDVTTAKALAEALRRRARRNGPNTAYRLAPNAARDLLTLKLTHGCMTEGSKCMQAIGRELEADFLMFGKLERVESGAKVVMKLFDVNDRKDIATSPPVIIPAGEQGKGDLARWGQRIYDRLTGEKSQGSLAITGNVDRGRVFVDGEPMGALADGAATLDDLPEGNHEIAIEADGYRRYEGTVTIVAGERSALAVELAAAFTGEPGEPVDRPGGRKGLYRGLFYGSAALTVAAGGAMLFAGSQVSGAESDLADALVRLEMEQQVDELAGLDPCSLAFLDGVDSMLTRASILDACDRGKQYESLTPVAAVITGVALVAAGVLFYKGFLSSGGAGARADGTAQARRLDIAPVVAPGYRGAAVTLSF